MCLALSFLCRCVLSVTTILKTDGDDTFQYNSAFWTSSTSTLNPSSNRTDPGNAKYAEYNTLKFDFITVCVGSVDNCIEPYQFSYPMANAAELFGGGDRREGVNQSEFVRVFGPSGMQNCGPQRPGFDVQCSGGNHARWGYCNNIPSQGCQTADSNDADGVIGLGLTGQDCCPMGAGYTNYFVSNSANGGNEQRVQAWVKIWISPEGAAAPPPPPAVEWIVLLSVGSFGSVDVGAVQHFAVPEDWQSALHPSSR